MVSPGAFDERLDALRLEAGTYGVVERIGAEAARVHEKLVSRYGGRLRMPETPEKLVAAWPKLFGERFEERFEPRPTREPNRAFKMRLLYAQRRCRQDSVCAASEPGVLLNISATSRSKAVPTENSVPAQAEPRDRRRELRGCGGGGRGQGDDLRVTEDAASRRGTRARRRARAPRLPGRRPNEERRRQGRPRGRAPAVARVTAARAVHRLRILTESRAKDAPKTIVSAQVALRERHLGRHL